MKKNLLVAQSGGPTAVINASLCGVIREGMRHPEEIGMVYGAVNGIQGILEGTIIRVDDQFETAADFELLCHTPSSALGSCRYKMPSPDKGPEQYAKILEMFRKYNIGYFAYIGGNDSMDTANKIADYCYEHGEEVRVVGVPKTIDNDLAGTDHCPGFASAAKYIATSFMEVSRDCQVYDKGMVTVIECMGRHAGWLTAASACACTKNDGPDLIYLPEVDFNMEQFIADVKRVYNEKHNCLVAVSEGIHYADGTFVSEAKTSGTDGFGHAQLGGLAARLTDVIKKEMGVKVRPIELSLLQRCAAHCASGTDIAESFMSGKVAVESAVAGITDKMVGFKCTRGADGYKCEPELFDLSLVANTEKKVPRAWINAEGNGVTKEFLDYCMPLIQGETNMVKEDGLPRFVHLKKVFAK